MSLGVHAGNQSTKYEVHSDDCNLGKNIFNHCASGQKVLFYLAVALWLTVSTVGTIILWKGMVLR